MSGTGRADRRRRGAGVRLMLALGLMPVAAAGGEARAQTPQLEVRIDTSEADAVLAILALHGDGRTVPESAWAALFATDGYRRLQRREHSLGRTFEDSAFRRFALTDTLAVRAPLLAATLESWRSVDPEAAARRAFAYLPPDTRLRATIYPVIKPAPNTFVFETATDPAIFFYLDPELTAAQFENTLAHELHHIGYTAACSDAPEQPAASRLRLGAFGEGIAMLAAAGGADVHPHATSVAADRARWDADVMRFDDDVRTLERYFLDVLDGRLDEQAARERAMDFYGVQGPWYTVGWVMAAEIERTYGRDRLVAILCDPVALLETYNAAMRARGGAPARLVWSDALMTRLRE